MLLVCWAPQGNSLALLLNCAFVRNAARLGAALYVEPVDTCTQARPCEPASPAGDDPCESPDVPTRRAQANPAAGTSGKGSALLLGSGERRPITCLRPRT